MCVCVCVCAQSPSTVWLFVIPWTVATRLLCPWYFPGKNTGVGCYFLLHNNNNNKINQTLDTDTELGDIKWQELNACCLSEMACYGVKLSSLFRTSSYKVKTGYPSCWYEKKKYLLILCQMPRILFPLFWLTVWPLPEMHPSFSREDNIIVHLFATCLP